jgi:hypothetical protein
MPGHGYFGGVGLLHVCSVPGCPELCEPGRTRCPEHVRGSDRRSRAYRQARELVLERDQHGCQAVVLGANPAECGGGLQAHHVVDVALGGTDELANLVCLCRVHNNAARRSPPPRWVKDLELIGPPALRRRQRVAASASAERLAPIEGGNGGPRRL